MLEYILGILAFAFIQFIVYLRFKKIQKEDRNGLERKLKMVNNRMDLVFMTAKLAHLLELSRSETDELLFIVANIPDENAIKASGFILNNLVPDNANSLRLFLKHRHVPRGDITKKDISYNCANAEDIAMFLRANLLPLVKS